MACDPTAPEACYGWNPTSRASTGWKPRTIRPRPKDFIRDAGDAQIRAWNTAIPTLQHEVGEIIDPDSGAAGYTAILEYELPMEARRSDVVLLVRGPVIVLELKARSFHPRRTSTRRRPTHATFSVTTPSSHHCAVGDAGQ